MSVWYRVYCPFLANRLNRPLLTSITISTTFLLALIIYRVFFHIPAPVSSVRYKPSELDDVEDIEEYEHGGFHPVHLRDIYDDRYKILHKLGWGGFSTVWLARDLVLSRYVALKIILADALSDCSELEIFQKLGVALGEERKAEGGRYIGGLLDSFAISGPNGTHLCLVSELMGPSIDALGDCCGKVGDRRRLQANFTRKIARQVVLGLKFLHSKQVCHGGALRYQLKRRDVANIVRSHFFEHTI
jgi:serine/threonine-protein kinase SRPK3